MSTATQTLPSQTPKSFLRKVLLLDAVTCLAMGALLLAAAGWLAAWTGLPRNFIVGAGAALFPCAALMWFASRAGTQANPPSWLAWGVILGNVAWVGASVLAIAVLFSPTPFGGAFVALQAVAVVVLALLEYRAMR